MHMHLDKERCLEVLVVKGRLKQVKALADQIKAIKGVIGGELVITPMR
jgi:CopG family nickel-responsive transcriptional regulator